MWRSTKRRSSVPRPSHAPPLSLSSSLASTTKSAMARVARYPLFRMRYRLLVLVCVVYLVYVCSPRSPSFSISAESVIQWSAQLGNKVGRLPPLKGSEEWGAQVPPPPEDPKAAKRRKQQAAAGWGSGNGRMGGNGAWSDAVRSMVRGNKGSKGSSDPYAADKGTQKPLGNGGKGNEGAANWGPQTAKEREELDMKLKAAAAAVGVPGKAKPDPLEAEFVAWRGPDYEPRQKGARKPEREKGPPVPDPFPLLSKYPPSDRALLRAPKVNRPPKVHFPVKTPLLIGFTRNWPQLVQCVASYIAAGWPAEDIYIVENTGVMYANRDGKLTLQNPFYLNHTQLGMLGVNVIITPTLLTFAQLQNFYAWTALEREWEEFFWSHEDVMVLSYENEVFVDDDSTSNSKTKNSQNPESYSLYTRAVAVLQYLRRPDVPAWANHFFAYDHLTLVHRDAILAVGGWDTHIPFYATDCDMYDRLMWAGYWQGETPIAHILDVSTVLDDVGALLRIPGIHASFAGDPGPDEVFEPGYEPTDEEVERLKAERETPAAKKREAARRKRVDKEGETFENLFDVGRRMEAVKYVDGGGWRNMWQLRQAGGEGEPFWRDPEGFETGLRMMIDTGRKVFAEKWGHRGCDLTLVGIEGKDMWRLERDWDEEFEGAGNEGNLW